MYLEVLFNFFLFKTPERGRIETTLSSRLSYTFHKTTNYTPARCVQLTVVVVLLQLAVTLTARAAFPLPALAPVSAARALPLRSVL